MTIARFLRQLLHRDKSQKNHFIPAPVLPPLPPSKAGRGKRILVVDDEPNIARLIEVNLLRQGYEVTTAADGQEALDKIYAARPDLLISDVMMPVLDGFALTNAIQKDPALDNLLIVLMGFCLEGPDESWKDCGATAFINKPFNPQEFVREINRLLELPPDVTPTQSG